MRDRDVQLRMTRGDSPVFPFVVEDDNGPVDLTGITVVFGARARVDDASYAIHHDSAGVGGITVADVAGGAVEVRLDPGDTSALTGPTTLLWELEVIDPSDRPTTVARGLLRITPDVVRP